MNVKRRIVARLLEYQREKLKQRLKLEREVERKKQKLAEVKRKADMRFEKYTKKIGYYEKFKKVVEKLEKKKGTLEELREEKENTDLKLMHEIKKEYYRHKIKSVNVSLGLVGEGLEKEIHMGYLVNGIKQKGVANNLKKMVKEVLGIKGNFLLSKIVAGYLRYSIKQNKLISKLVEKRNKCIEEMKRIGEEADLLERKKIVIENKKEGFYKSVRRIKNKISELTYLISDINTEIDEIEILKRNIIKGRGVLCEDGVKYGSTDTLEKAGAFEIIDDEIKNNAILFV